MGTILAMKDICPYCGGPVKKQLISQVVVHLCMDCKRTVWPVSTDKKRKRT